jgi:Putative Ig domain
MTGPETGGRSTDSFTPPLKISQTFTLNVLNRIVLPNWTLPDAVQGISYTEYLQPAGGTPPYHFSLASYPLPPGILLDPSSGKVFGTPAVASLPFYASFPVTISDSASPPASINPEVTLTVKPPMSIDTTSLPDSARGLNYDAAIYTLGGRPPYTIKVTNGALPTGVAATASWINVNLAGVPTTDGLYKFTVQVSDSYETPNTVSRDFQIRISDQMALSGPTLVQILYNQSYSTTFPATGGFPPYTWSIDRPIPGFTFDSTTGTLSGTAIGGSYTSPNISVRDSSNPPLSAAYFNFALEAWSKLIVTTTSLPTIGTTSAILLQPFANGGAVPYQWSVSSGTFPPGLSLASSNGTISGSPTTAGVYTFNLNISDVNTGNLHQTTSQQLTWTVKDRGQMTRNDIAAQATAISNISLLASISPFNDPSSAGPDVDVYSMSAAPGAIVQVYADANNDFIQPPEPNSLFPVLEIVDSTGNRYQTCSFNYQIWTTIFNSQCVNGLNGAAFSKQVGFAFQVPGTGTAPVTFYVRVSDARGDARPDFIYTFTAYGVD